MRIISYIAAFGTILFSAYWLTQHAYPHFYHRTGSQFAAELMLTISIAFASLGVLYLVKRLP